MRCGIADWPPGSTAGAVAARFVAVGSATIGGTWKATSVGASIVIRSVVGVRGSAGRPQVHFGPPQFGQLVARVGALWQQVCAESAAADAGAWQHVLNSVPPWLQARAGYGTARAATRVNKASDFLEQCIVGPMLLLRSVAAGGSGAEMQANPGQTGPAYFPFAAAGWTIPIGRRRIILVHRPAACATTCSVVAA